MALRLLVRLIKKLPTHGDFAVTSSRQSGQREILCAFADSSDAALVAKAASASMSDRARYSFVLDEAAEQSSQNCWPARTPPAARDNI